MRTYILIAMALLSLTSEAQQRWSLQECIDHAIKNNINIKRQENSIEQDEIALNTAKMSLLPGVNASVNQNWDMGRGLTMDNTYVNNRNTSLTMVDLSADVILFQGLQKINTIRARKLNLEASIADLDKAKEDMGISVTQAYLQVLYAEEMLGVAREQVELSKSQLMHRCKMADNGKASESEVAQARSRVAQDEMSVVQSDNDYKLAVLELSQMLELESPEGFLIESPDTSAQLLPIAGIEEIYSDALRNKAIIRGDQKRIEGAERNVSIAKGGHAPTVRLSGGVNSKYYGLQGEDLDYTFGEQMRANLSKSINISVNVPIFNRFATRNDVRTAKSQVVAQNLQLDADKKALYKEVQQAYYNAVAAESKYGSSLSAEESASVSWKLMMKKYDNGKATQTEYNESRTQYTKSVAERIQAKYEYIFRAKILDFYRGL